MTNPIRLQADLERLRALAAALRRDDRAARRPDGGLATARSRAALRDRTLGALSGRRHAADPHRIALPARYPFQPPTATVLTPDLAPERLPRPARSASARDGSPSEGLDLFVQRLARLLTFDSLLVNTASAANRAAADWYERARRRHPQAFPSDRPVRSRPPRRGSRAPRVGWRTRRRTMIACRRPARAAPARCGCRAGRRGRVRCPGCGAPFEAVT